MSPPGQSATRVSASTALHTLLDEQVAAIQAADGRLRTGGRSGVHRMRVALRRLRSTLSTFRPCLDDSVDGLRQELRWFASELSPARDAEVLRARLAAACADDPRLGSAAFEALEPFLELEERNAQAAAEEAWGSDRYAALSAALVRLFASELITLDGQVEPLEAFAPVVAAEVDKVRRRAEQTAAAGDRDELVHQLRKATKRARYATEVLLPFERKPAAKLARRLERLQVLLGDRQDSAVARGYLHRLLGDGGLDRHGTEVVERLLVHEAAVTAGLDERLPYAVERATRPGRLLRA
jgi:CHAD domain-containing protein